MAPAYRGPLPGFYFDNDKQKYFKVQASHQAPSPQTKYSRDNILKDRRTAERLIQHELRRTQISLQRVKRRTDHALGREIGCRPAYASIYGGNLSRPVIRARTQGVATSIVAVPSEDRNEFIVGSNDPSMERGWFQRYAPEQSSSLDHTFSRELIFPAVSTLSISPRSTILFAFLNSPSAWAMTAQDYVVENRLPRLHPCFDAIDDDTIASSAGNPFVIDKDMFVVGNGAGTVLVQSSDSAWNVTQSLRGHHSDVLATGWLDANTASLGLRNGTVKLWDVRAHGTALRLRHPSSINAIRRVNSQNLVVAGLEDQLALYDLRMPVDKKSKPRRHGPAPPPSQPAVAFLYENRDRRSLGLDVHAELGVLAAASQDGTVSIYSLSTGNVVKQLRKPCHDRTTKVTQSDLSGETSTLLFYHDMITNEDRLIGTTGHGLWTSGWGPEET